MTRHYYVLGAPDVCENTIEVTPTYKNGKDQSTSNYHYGINGFINGFPNVSIFHRETLTLLNTPPTSPPT